ncbi:MAG: hypothetical protein OXG89_03540 [bacterium]|nr:hypothetical protein [bacterium]
MRSRNQPTLSDHSQTAILLTGPSNRTLPAALAADCLADLHIIDPANRVIPRALRRPS